MRTLNNYYLQSFEKYAADALNNILFNDSISSYAQMLNFKANAILSRAYLNVNVNIPKLQRDLFQTGKEYVQKFAIKQKEIKSQKDFKRHTATPLFNQTPTYIFSNN